MMNFTPTFSDLISETNPSSNSEMDWSYIDLLWTLAFSTIVITSIVGNSLVIWIVTGWYLGFFCLRKFWRRILDLFILSISAFNSTVFHTIFRLKKFNFYKSFYHLIYFETEA